jgi:hypothetical protein
MIVGGLPIVLGQFDVEASEMMHVQYMPIKFAGNRGDYRVPDNLKCFQPLIEQVDAGYDDLVYLTAKYLYVTPENLGNRPGWHVDGFGTDDINYFWYDSAPTDFCDQIFDISDDEHLSMLDMTNQVCKENIVTYPVRTLLQIDNRVVHRTSESAVAGFRTFVKLSVSKDIYNLKGNAHNYLFDYNWSMISRDVQRNVTSK